MIPEVRPGKRNLLTDVAGLLVGQAEDQRLKSGVTVVLGEAPMVASVAVQGGAPGTRETDLLEPDRSAPAVDAFVLSGGSAFGLDAASGVMAGLRAMGRGFAVGEARVPIVPAAIVFDLLNGGAKDWDASPYPALGRAALEDCGEEFGLGSHGGGTGATTATLKGGVGSASAVIGGLTVGALVVANPVGNVTTPGGRHFWAAPFEAGAEFGGLGPDPSAGLGALSSPLKVMPEVPGKATTIAVVATDAALGKAQAKRMAVAAHDGIARAIVPAHTPADGDLVFAAATGRSGVVADDGAMVLLCALAADCLARAIARAVFSATPAAGDLLPTWREANG